MLPSFPMRSPIEYQTVQRASARSRSPSRGHRCGAFGGAGLVSVDQLVAALLDSSQISAGIDVVDAVVQECGPVVGHNRVQVLNQLIEFVGHDERAGVAAFGQEDLFKIVERLFVVGHLADQGVGVEPKQLAFLVIILPAPPIRPGGIAAAQDAGGDGGVLSGTPLAAGLVIEVGGRLREPVAILRLRLQAGARSQHIAEILRHAFVDPQQRSLLRSVQIRLIKAIGAAILAVPGVRKLVRKQIGFAQLVGIVGKSLFADAVV